VSDTLVDSSVLLDILTNDPEWSQWSGANLDECAKTGTLCINAIIYAEVSIGFNLIEEVEEALPAASFSRLHLPLEAAFLAGKAFVQYKRRGGARSAPLPDFFVGAHAAVAGLGLLTRDAARIRTYFPTVKLISPDE